MISYFTLVVITSFKVTILVTRPIVNYEKDWLYHLFPFPGLVWSEKEFYFGCDHQGEGNNHYWAIFGMVTNERTNEQTGEPSASLLLTSVRRQSFAKALAT